MSEFEGPGTARTGTELRARQREENSREVAGGVSRAVGALREAETQFRAVEANFQERAAMTASPTVADAALEMAQENGRMARLCGQAAADLEGALSAAFQAAADRVDRKPRQPLDVFGAFAAGWAAHTVAETYLAQEEPRVGAMPPCTLEDALALFRAQIAKAAG